MSDFEQRVLRERETYDQGLDRRLFRPFAHAAHHYRLRRRKLVEELLEGKSRLRALEIGGTLGWQFFFERQLAQGAQVVCSNISLRELDKGLAAAGRSSNPPDFVICDAHRLPFPDASFDVVFGVAVLHHLSLHDALAEIERVLVPGGLMFFAEPLELNPVARVIRHLTPQARTEDEKPFGRGELALIGERFACSFHYEQLFSVPASLLSGLLYASPDNPVMRFAFRLDEGLKRLVPALGPYYRYVFIVGRRRPEHTVRGRPSPA